MDIIALFGIMGFFVVAIIWAYKAGGKYTQKDFEVKGHEEVEKHLIKQTEQINEVTAKYDALRKRLLLGVRDDIRPSDSEGDKTKTP